MRRLKLQMQLSIDGFAAGPNNEMGWMTWDMDDGLKAYISALTAPVDGILMGRNLAAGFIPAWEGRLADAETADDFALKMVNTPKYIFSETPGSFEAKNAALITGDLKEEVNRLKAKPGGDLITYGGAGFAASLIKEGLIDDYYLFVNPAAIGTGKSVFNKLNGRLNLRLAEARSFSCGVAVLHYQQ